MCRGGYKKEIKRQGVEASSYFFNMLKEFVGSGRGGGVALPYLA